MSRVELKIYYKDGSVTKQRAVVNKWKFQDSMMGEQYIMFNITSEIPIDFAVGDFCTFRGETYTLNYVPSVTQKARSKERQDSYTYENVKFESFQEELTRCLMLDITPTTGDYVAALGTNYTGSSKFQLFCGETSANGSTLTAVCALAAKMQANLDRMFPTNGWKIFVDTTSTYLNTVGDAILVTHTEDKVLSFDNTTVAKALEEVHNTFDLNYCIRGRSIYIGYNLKNLTSDNDNETFAFGYGKGYPTPEDMNKGLFMIKRIANSQQKIVTRLRALGSTKNMPYRYYNKAYELPQSLFPTNLQLPDTFLPMTGTATKKRTDDPINKTVGNANRDNVYGINNITNLPYVRHVQGDTNDAYIDKNDDAEHCAEGIREDSARWDGSNGDLPEIYPTIESAVYSELRGAGVADQDGNTSGANHFSGYGSNERVDELLAIGYQSDGTQVDDANTGDGILTESETVGIGSSKTTIISEKTIRYQDQYHGAFTYSDGFLIGPEETLFSVNNVLAGKYAMAPTFGAVYYGFRLMHPNNTVTADVGFRITIKQKSKSSGNIVVRAVYVSDLTHITPTDNIKEVELPELPDVKNNNNVRVSEISVTELSDIIVTFEPIMRNVTGLNGSTDYLELSYKVGNSSLGNGNTSSPEYTWISADGYNSISDFHVFIKDMGFDITACWNGEIPVVSMKSGQCVGREFEIGENIEKVTYNGKKGYMLSLHRAIDSSLNTYYPSAVNKIAAGDHFVLLNINMPDAYIKMAEVRLLRAATEYLADNCETQFTYQPSIDDIYLQRNYDNMVKAGTPQSSIFWRLYAGLKFTFRGIPASEDSPAPLADITIEQVSISMGEGLTPKVELKLNDDVQQTTLQKLTTSVDRIYNGSLFGNGSSNVNNVAALMSILQSEGGKMFVSKKHDDVAEGKITFKDVDTHEVMSEFKKGLKIGTFNSGLLGTGAAVYIDQLNNSFAEFDYITIRKTANFRSITILELKHIGGELGLTAGAMVISKVETNENENFFRCYFDTTDGKRQVYQEFIVGDQARCQQFRLDPDPNAQGMLRTKYYWRLVVGVGEDYVDLSKTDADTGSGIPTAGDEVIQLGYRGDDHPERQSAIILSAVASDAPSQKFYQGINSYNLVDKFVKEEGYDPTTGLFHCNIYGNFFVGDKGSNPQSYMRYTPQNGLVIAGKVEMLASSTFNGEAVQNIIGTLNTAAENAQTAAENAQGTADGAQDAADQAQGTADQALNGLTNLRTGNENLIVNGGFAGSYESESVESTTTINSGTTIFSDPFGHWDVHNGCTIVNAVASATGLACQLSSGLLKQTVSRALTSGTTYTFSLLGIASGSVTVSIGGASTTIAVTAGKRSFWTFEASTASAELQVSGSATITELQLIEGNIQLTDWTPSPLDNNRYLSYYKNVAYLLDAIENASTTVLGGLILTEMIRVGNYADRVMQQETGGMNGKQVNDNSPFLWGGGNFTQAIETVTKYNANPMYQPNQADLANMAKFVVTHGGRAILTDIILRGYIYAEGGIFKSVQSKNGNWSLDEQGNMTCQNATIKGNQYTPMFRLTAENYATVITDASTINPQIDLTKTGLNIVVESIPSGARRRVILPQTGEEWNGARFHIVNNCPQAAEIGFLVGPIFYWRQDPDTGEVYKDRDFTVISVYLGGSATFVAVLQENGVDIEWHLLSLTDGLHYVHPE